MTKLNEEMSLRFLKREAKLCSFLQKSFLALEQVRAWVGPSVLTDYPSELQIYSCWAGEMARRLGALAALPEDPV
jgi:hypothetical protein